MSSLVAAAKMVLGTLKTTTKMTPAPAAIHPVRLGDPPATLDRRRTMLVEFSPDWKQHAMNRCTGPSTLLMTIGPKGAIPSLAEWVLAFHIFVSESELNHGLPKDFDEEPIPNHNRTIIWAAPSASSTSRPKCDPILDKKNTSLTKEGSMRLVQASICMTEGATSSLSYIRPRVPPSRGGFGYLRMVTNAHYLFLLTFDVGSKAGGRVGPKKAWYPQFYLHKGGPTVLRSFDPYKTETGLVPLPSSPSQCRWYWWTDSTASAEESASAEAERIYEGIVVAAAQPKPGLQSAAFVAAVPGSNGLRLLNSELVKRPPLHILPPIFVPTNTASTESAAAPPTPPPPPPSPLPPTSKSPFLLSSTKSPTISSASASPPAIKADTAVGTLLELIDALKVWPEKKISLPPPPTNSQTFPSPFAIEQFYDPNEFLLGAALNAIEVEARRIDHTEGPVYHPMQTMLRFFDVFSRVHFLRTIFTFESEPSVSAADTKTCEADAIGAGAVYLQRVAELETKSLETIRHLCSRVEWLLALQIRAGMRFPVPYYIRTLAADTTFVGKMEAVERQALDLTNQITATESGRVKRYQLFTQKTGVPWPHAAHLNHDLTIKTGFAPYPTFALAGRRQCTVCKVVINTLLPWQNLADMHDHTRHAGMNAPDPLSPRTML